MPDHVIQEILTENAAVLSTPVTVNKIAHDFYEEHGYQPFHLMKEVVFDNRAGILISKEHYRLKEKLDPIIMRMVESRIIDKIEADYRPETCKHANTIDFDQSNKSLSFQMMSIFRMIL